MVFYPSFIAIMAQCGCLAKRKAADIYESIPPTVKAGGWTTPKAFRKWLNRNFDRTPKIDELAKSLI